GPQGPRPRCNTADPCYLGIPAVNRRATQAPGSRRASLPSINSMCGVSMIPRRRSRVLPPLARVLTLAALLSAPAVARAQKAPEETVKSFKVADGLEATLWATEPGMVNPTDMDIDERGRIWVCEAANYRGSKLRPEGDRIMVLEDTDHDGVCDSYKVFVQDPQLFAPLGIAKLGNKLYVSQSPNVWVYTIDESG